jgi:hypothetical protein
MKNLRKYLLASCLFFSLSAPRLEAGFSPNIQGLVRNCANSVALTQNLALSMLGFMTLNVALFHQELWHGTTNVQSLVLISGIEIAKNLVNYVLIENSAQIPLSIVTWLALNEYRRSLVSQPANKELCDRNASECRPVVSVPENGIYPQWFMDLLFASVEVLKNRINFVITENTFPHEWSKPPQPVH